jgi:hypothetical protein
MASAPLPKGFAIGCAVLGLLSLGAPCAPAATPPRSPEFMRYWKSGLAEISSYEIVEERYGELRKGQAVLLYVYEETDAATRIKAETAAIPQAARIPVLKLNRILRFNAGIYDYSVMTSVFSGLSGPFIARPFEPVKIAMTSQEWCGSVYHHLVPMGKVLKEELHSYFESEGDRRDSLAIPDSVYYEDELPVTLRELDGPWLASGRELSVRLIPGLWRMRTTHRPVSILAASLAKSDTLAPGLPPAFVFTLRIGPETWRYRVEKAPPHRILGWSNSMGESGTLAKTVRKAYWEENRNRDIGLRRELGLRFGAGDGEAP